MAYAAADVIVIPGRTMVDPTDAEGFGIAFLEAAACGAPSLAGRSGGIQDAVEIGATGFMVDPLDPAALADKMLLLMAVRSLLRRMSETAVARASSRERVDSAYWSARLA